MVPMVRESAFPSLERRGGRALKKKNPFRKGADGVVAHRRCFGMRVRNVACERPPRLRRFGRSAAFVLMAQPPLLCKEGESALHNLCSVDIAAHIFLMTVFSARNAESGWAGAKIPGSQRLRRRCI